MWQGHVSSSQGSAKLWAYKDVSIVALCSTSHDSLVLWPSRCSWSVPGQTGARGVVQCCRAIPSNEGRMEQLDLIWWEAEGLGQHQICKSRNDCPCPVTLSGRGSGQVLVLVANLISAHMGPRRPQVRHTRVLLQMMSVLSFLKLAALESHPNKPLSVTQQRPTSMWGETT